MVRFSRRHRTNGAEAPARRLRVNSMSEIFLTCVLEAAMSDIFQEELVVEPVGQRVRCTETLYSGNTGMQDIKVIDTLAYGRVLVLDGIMHQHPTVCRR